MDKFEERKVAQRKLDANLLDSQMQNFLRILNNKEELSNFQHGYIKNEINNGRRKLMECNPNEVLATYKLMDQVEQALLNLPVK